MNRTGSITLYRKKLEENFFFKLSVLYQFRKQRKLIINSIDKKCFNIIKDKYFNAAPAPGYSKYLDVDAHITLNLWRAYILGLQESEPKKILDIGTGCGYFPYICRFYGHDINTIDISGEPIFNEVTEILKVERFIFEVKEYRSIPDFSTKFDLITAFMIYFNNHKNDNLWGPEEWRFFLEDLTKNHMTPNAEAYFILNAEPKNNKWYTDELYNFFIATGAEIDNDRVYYKSLSYFRSRELT